MGFKIGDTVILKNIFRYLSHPDVQDYFIGVVYYIYDDGFVGIYFKDVYGLRMSLPSQNELSFPRNILLGHCWDFIPEQVCYLKKS